MRNLAVAILLLSASVAAAQAPAKDDGVRPVGADGKALNLDFETGTLQDWSADGTAFDGQPTDGDTVSARRGDMRSRHQGRYWIGSYEKHGDKPQGTLTSVPFPVTQPWASFLVGGGAHETTCVEIVRKDTGERIFRASGLDEEDMRRVVVDLKGHLGKPIFVRLVDRHAAGWGHVNFDDFRFHAEKPSLPQRQGPPAADVYTFAGLSAEKAAQAMTVPEGFDVKLFAGEPDVVQPIAMCLDDRGRVWVAEAYSYPIRRSEKEAKDRILIFEDTDGDGKFDKRTVFMEGLNLVSGLEVGFGGVWIGAAPHLLFVPMKDDRPAGEPKILLDGWGFGDTHETLNTFMWGPDGWLYGCHGVFTHSRVGKPGLPDSERTPINAGIWRYHPTRHVFEVFAHGTSNPWGLDFNAEGQAFCEACVIPHCYHIIQGGRYERQAGQHFNPYTYDDIKTIADHRHYVGGNPHGGNNRSTSAGGGHAHCGLMCYLGGAWPSEYRNRLFMGNIHGRRLNVDVLRAKGSGYVAGHAPDFLLANDAWARFINFRYGPDGNVFLIDWYDKQACHHGDPKIWDRSNGRIYKVCYRDTKPVQVDLTAKTDKELVALQTHANDWYVRHARRLLAERKPGEDVRAELEALLRHESATVRLRALWALHVTGGLSFAQIEHGLKDENEFVRGWTIQLAVEQDGTETLRPEKLVELAQRDASPVVHRYLASALQRMTFDVREAVLEHLVRWDADASDANLPLLYWYALEPLAGNTSHRKRALEIARKGKLSNLYAYAVRRIASDPEALGFLLSTLPAESDAENLVALRELQNALKGRPRTARPTGWSSVFAKLMQGSPEVRSQAFGVAATLGDETALASLREVLADPKTDVNDRQRALGILVSVRHAELPAILHQLLEPPTSPELRGAALRALAQYDDPATPGHILGLYASLAPPEKRDALNTLAARNGYARALLDALSAKKIAASDVSADIVRQLRNLRDKDLDRRIAEAWGVVRDTPADRVKVIAQYREKLSGAKGEPAEGRAVFAKVCQQCHTLFGEGGKVGPDITGANRADLHYLLENILDPSAVIPKEYAATVLELNNGRVITGIVKEETPVLLTVVTANETLTVPRGDVASRQPTATSMMPDDLLKTLGDREVRALIAYLQSPVQVGQAQSAPDAKATDLFNGKDFTGWDGDTKDTWRIEDGCIVGGTLAKKTPRNEFLASKASYKDFVLKLKFKLLGDSKKSFVNSGVQIRSQRRPGDSEMIGYQADLGDPSWWACIYDESRRNKVLAQADMAKLDKVLRRGEWNEYEIRAEGRRIRTYINGVLGVDYIEPDEAIPQEGRLGLQIHGGGPAEVWFKEITIQAR